MVVVLVVFSTKKNLLSFLLRLFCPMAWKWIKKLVICYVELSAVNLDR